MKPILILGVDSILAQALLQRYSDTSVGLNKKQCDITSTAYVEKTISTFDGSYVFNCAAITDIEYCEKDPISCMNVNTNAVYILNEVCKKYNKKLIHISSDYAVRPCNTYGWSKYLSEKILDKKFLIVRTNFYHSKTFAVFKLLQNHSIKSYTNVFFNPISIHKLVEELYNHKDDEGILNIFTKDKISYFDFAKLVCTVFRINSHLVTPTKFQNMTGHAPRPLTSYIKSDITIGIQNDLINFRKYISSHSHKGGNP